MVVVIVVIHVMMIIVVIPTAVVVMVVMTTGRADKHRQPDHHRGKRQQCSLHLPAPIQNVRRTLCHMPGVSGSSWSSGNSENLLILGKETFISVPNSVLAM